MAMTDPLADMFTRILNAGKRGHEKVRIPASNLKEQILKTLQSEGFILDFRRVHLDGHPVLEVDLRYFPGRQKKSFISGIRRVSKPGRRVYVGRNEIPRVMGGLGIAILTTPQGVLTGEKSRENSVGGEVLCQVW